MHRVRMYNGITCSVTEPIQTRLPKTATVHFDHFGQRNNLKSCIRSFLFESVFLIELFNTTLCLSESLTASVERMAI